MACAVSLGVTAPKMALPGTTMALTRRCAFRKMDLAPVAPVVQQTLQYCLALAQLKTGALLHADCFMPNHLHSLVTYIKRNAHTFKRYLFGESGKALKVVLAELGFEPPENIWSASEPHEMALLDVEANLIWANYVHTNPVRANLVEKVSQYPGYVTDPGLMLGREVTVQRPDVYFDPKKCPSELTIHYTMPPMLKRMDPEKVVYRLRQAAKATERARKKRGGQVIGAANLTSLHPWAEPKSPRRFGNRVKAYMVGGTDADAVELKIRAALETREHRQDHRAAFVSRRNGDLTAKFPHATLAMHSIHGAPIEDPPEPGASVFLPNTELAPLSKEDTDEAVTLLKQQATDLLEVEDTLGARILAGAEDEVDRTAPGATQQTERPEPKRVVLRDSTASAKKRRKQIQAQRALKRRVADKKTEPDPPDE